MLVKHNLRLACEAAEYLRQNAASEYEKLGLSSSECVGWEKLAKDLPIARNPQTGRLQQDDTFHLLEPLRPEALKDGDMASYHNISFDRVQRYKVIKQADLLLIMTRLPELFTADEKRQAWLDYMPVCLHDSTLSFATHALFAAQNGDVESAAFFLRKALLLDLRDIMGNTGKEGLHLANLGESWQALTALYGSASNRKGCVDNEEQADNQRCGERGRGIDRHGVLCAER
jgi:kojibiose phosphorylase